MNIGLVLIVDDDEAFRESTCRLLRREGFDCHGVQNAEEAIDTLRHGRYDVLVADIRTPHDLDLGIVRQARDLDHHLPIILVTGYPSAQSAIQAIGLAVEGYMTKPVDIDGLLTLLYKAVQRSRNRRRLSAVVERLCSVVADLEAEDPGRLSHNEGGDGSSLATIRTLASCLSDLLVVWQKPAAEHGLNNLCELLECPQRAVHRQAILHAIEVLERTKDNFKSRQLAELRTNLQQVLGIK